MTLQKKYYNACKTCDQNIHGFGKCKAGFDNWYKRKTKNNKCEKCVTAKHEKSELQEPEVLKYTVYTDGGCAINPGGPGGYGVIIQKDGKNGITELSQGYISTTNNRMEIMGVLKALEYLPAGSIANIYSDSQYVINCMRGLWEKKKNIDLWNKVAQAAEGKSITMHWVKGHNGNEFNERCDLLATTAMYESDKIRDEEYASYMEAHRTNKAITSANTKKGAMGNPIIIPEDTGRQHTVTGDPYTMAEETGINLSCARSIITFADSRKIFKDYKDLKTGGMDNISIVLWSPEEASV